MSKDVKSQEIPLNDFMDTNIIYCGDNAEVMRTHIQDNSIDLIYADPPFFSNKAYEVLWGDGYELSF